MQLAEMLSSPSSNHLMEMPGYWNDVFLTLVKGLIQSIRCACASQKPSVSLSERAYSSSSCAEVAQVHSFSAALGSNSRFYDMQLLLHATPSGTCRLVGRIVLYRRAGFRPFQNLVARSYGAVLATGERGGKQSGCPCAAAPGPFTVCAAFPVHHGRRSGGAHARAEPPTCRTRRHRPRPSRTDGGHRRVAALQRPLQGAREGAAEQGLPARAASRRPLPRNRAAERRTAGRRLDLRPGIRRPLPLLVVDLSLPPP